MTKNTIQAYLNKPDSKILGSLLNKLSQLNRMNKVLKDCLGDDAVIMEHCYVVNISGKSLIIIADSPHWVTRLRFYIPELLSKIRQQPGLEHLKAIYCKAQPSLYLERMKKTTRSKLKLKPQTSEKILEISKELKDTRIKALLEKIAGHKE